MKLQDNSNINIIQFVMGPTASKARQQPPPNQEQIVFSHPRFKNVRVISSPSEEDDGVIETSIPMPGQGDFKKWQKRITELGQLQTIFLPVGQRFQKTQFCGSGGIAWIQYKNYPYLLSDEINNRSSMECKYFEQAELWYLIYSIVGAAVTFHSKGLKVGDVRPENVFISHEGQVRVATQLTWPNEQTNYLKTIFDKEITYLSPEELKDINYGKLDEGTNAHLSEAFSVGLTCYDAATLTNSNQLYQNGNKFNYAILEQNLAALEQSHNYSQPLKLLIKGLCQVQPSRRITCKEVANWLDHYQEYINQLQDFKFQQVPEKLLTLKVQQQGSRNSIPQQQQYYQAKPTQNRNTVPGGVPPQVVQRQQQVQQPYYSGTVPMIQSLYGEVGAVGINPQQVLVTQQMPVNVQVGSGVGRYQLGSGGGKGPQQTGSNVGRGPQAGSGVGKGPQQVGSGVNNGQNYPSAVTFQKDPRSGVGESGFNDYSQSRGVNLSQIDQQLELSRKMFPS